MPVIHLNYTDLCDPFITNGSTVFLCLNDFEDKTVSGTNYVNARVVNIGKVIIDTHGCNPCNPKYNCLYALEINLNQFLEDPETEEPYEPTVNDINGIFSENCLTSWVQFLKAVPPCIADIEGNTLTVVDECLYVPAGSFCLSEDPTNIAEFDEGCLLVSIDSSTTQLIGNNAGSYEGNANLVFNFSATIPTVTLGSSVSPPTGASQFRAYGSDNTGYEAYDEAGLLHVFLGHDSGDAVLDFSEGNFKIRDTGADVLDFDVGASIITSTYDIVVPTEVYGSGWNGSNEVPTKDAVYDKIQTLAATASFGNLTASLPVSLSATRQVLGGAANITIANASSSASGVVSTGTQTFSGIKTFNDKVIFADVLDLSNSVFIESEAGASLVPSLDQGVNLGSATKGFFGAYLTHIVCTDIAAGLAPPSSARINSTASAANNAFASYGTSTAPRTHHEFSNPNGIVGTIVTENLTTYFNTSSGIAVKKNLEPANGILDRINKISVVLGHFVTDLDADPKKVMFIYENLLELFPEACSKFGKPLVDYSKMVPVAMRGVQEVDNKANQSFKQLAILNKEIISLKEELDQIRSYLVI